MLTNDISKLQQGGAQYTAMCLWKRGTVDDLIVYTGAEDDYLLVVNAANTEKISIGCKLIYRKMSNHKCISHYTQLALQGPSAEKILQKLSENTALSEIGFFKFM
jgi:aminomethyltransferase